MTSGPNGTHARSRLDRCKQGWRRRRLALALVLVVVLSHGCAGSGKDDPLARLPLYVDTASTASTALNEDPASGALRVLARTPQARWFTEAEPDPRRAADAYVSAAAAARSMPVLVVYAIPQRDCGSFSAGGADPSSYLDLVDRLRAGIGRRPAVVLLEPDALADLDCLSVDGQRERLALMRAAVLRLASDPQTTTYVDAGHSRWQTPGVMAQRLRAVDAPRVRGFSLNVANFFSTAEEAGYGDRLAQLLPDAHYVIDVSRNGQGPAPDGPLSWCNPPGRAIGEPPHAVVDQTRLDALLWVKHPGESDGTCDRGEPRSGLWFQSYAVGLVERGQAR